MIRKTGKNIKRLDFLERRKKNGRKKYKEIRIFGTAK